MGLHGVSEIFFTVIALSPPCTEYSLAMTCRPRKLEEADEIVRAGLNVVDHFEPSFWFLENPQTGLLKDRTFMKPFGYVDVDYCQFCSWGYQKPTRIWGMGMGRLKPRVCDGKTCPSLILRSNGHMGHRKILGATPRDGATRVKLEDQYRIPEGVVTYVCGWERQWSDFKTPEFSVQETTARFSDPGDELPPARLENGYIHPPFGYKFAIPGPPRIPPPVWPNPNAPIFRTKGVTNPPPPQCQWACGM